MLAKLASVGRVLEAERPPPHTHTLACSTLIIPRACQTRLQEVVGDMFKCSKDIWSMKGVVLPL